MLVFRSVVIRRLLAFALTAVAFPAFAASLSFPDLDVELAELGAKLLRVGSDIPAREFARVQPGMPVSELKELLGQPVGDGVIVKSGV